MVSNFTTADLLNISFGSARTVFEYPVERGDVTLLITHPFGYSEMTLLDTTLQEIVKIIQNAFDKKVEVSNIKCVRLEDLAFVAPVNGDQINITAKYIDDFEEDKGIFTIAFDIKPRDGFISNSDRVLNSWAVLKMFGTIFPPLTYEDVLEMIRQHGFECGTFEPVDVLRSSIYKHGSTDKDVQQHDSECDTCEFADICDASVGKQPKFN